MVAFIVKKNLAFTLAEVLITLGIIGVVAALTIPELVNNIHNAELASAFIKDYSVLLQVSRDVINDSSGDITGIYPTAQDLADAMATKLKVNKSCTSINANGDCWPQLTTIKTLYGGDFTGNYNDNAPTLVLADGSTIRVYNLWYRQACDIWPRNFGSKIEGSCAFLHMDVNGSKKPNQLGRDIFEMAFYPTFGILPNGTQGTFDDYTTKPTCDVTNSNVDSGCGCAAKVLSERAINY